MKVPGFTLVECMIALFIHALLIAHIFMVYLHIKNNDMAIQAEVRRQERARLAMYTRDHSKCLIF